MKTRKNVFFRGIVVALALALTVLCFPIDAINVFALEEGKIDYNQITIGTDPKEDGTRTEIKTTVTKGGEYNIPYAYIGESKNDLKIGTVGNSGGTKINGSSDDEVTVTKSAVEVFYSSKDVTKDVSVGSSEDYYGSFVASQEGTYTIRYSYTYTLGEKSYTNSYDLKVVSNLPDASFNFKENDEYFIPSIIDLKQVKKVNKEGKESYEDFLYLPKPEVIQANGENAEVPEENYVTSLPDGYKTGKYVLISANGGVEGGKVDVETKTLDGGKKVFYISGDTIHSKGAYNYTIRYSYYENGEFVASTTKSTRIYNEDTPYYENYSLKYDLSPSWDTIKNKGKIGADIEIPTAIGVTTNNAGENQSVDVRYTVKVKYQANGEGTWNELSEELYNADENNQVLEGKEGDWYLKNPKSFNPLLEGSYEFIYTIYDIYGNSKSHDEGLYKFENIYDKDAPTPILYDASVRENEGETTVPTYEDASYKFKTRAVPNAVVVYAIGIDDNISKNGDEDVVLTRKIRLDQNNVKLTITDYNDYNLVFNYRKTAQSVEAPSNAYKNLLTNNFLIRKAVGKTEIKNDSDMKNWLKKNYYLIVIDNGNAEHIYGLFENELKALDESIVDFATFKEFLIKGRSEEENKEFVKKLIDAGFAYFDVSTTFGATTTGTTSYDSNIKGMGPGSYVIDYIAQDGKGNENTVTKSIYIGSYTDSEAPEITFSSTLNETYLPEATITFTAPTATDYGSTPDQNMHIETMYRFLDNTGKPITGIKDKDENKISTESLTELWNDLSADPNNDISKKLLEIYADYHDKELADATSEGYIKLEYSTKSYSINLKEVNKQFPNKASKIQIVSFVYDDVGNATIYATSANIANTYDSKAPKMLFTAGPDKTEFMQGDKITLPTLQIRDDNVSFLTYSVQVNFVETVPGKGEVRENVSVEGTKTTRDTRLALFTIDPGSFRAGAEGNYQAIITITDANNNSIVYFANYYAEGRIIVQSPQVNPTFSNKTIYLDGGGDGVDYDPSIGLEIPAPKISYQIEDSIVYEQFKKLSEEDIVDAPAEGKTVTPKHVIMGVDSNYVATEWSTSLTGKGQTFVAKQEHVNQTLKLTYTAVVDVYDRTLFKFVEGVDDKGDYVDLNKTGFFYIGGENKSSPKKIEFRKEGGYVVHISGSEVYDVYKDENGVIKAKKRDDEGEEITGEGFSSSNINWDWNAIFTNGLLHYEETSDEYQITVLDNKGPVLAKVYDDPELGYGGKDGKVLTQEDIKDGYTLKILGIEVVEDRSGINYSNSSIKLSWKKANGEEGSRTWTDIDVLRNGTTHDINEKGERVDGTYTITYHVEDMNGNPTDQSYEIKIGDTEGPEIDFKQVLKESYTVGSELIIDLNSIEIADPVGENWVESMKNETEFLEITLKNNSVNGSESDIEGELRGSSIVFNLEDVGSYTLTIKATDKVGNHNTYTKNFDVTTTSNDPTITYRVVGIVLIVVSVVVLVAVIIYFIVSKVKLDKELKKK